jgi:hypothetical protein
MANNRQPAAAQMANPKVNTRAAQMELLVATANANNHIPKI